VLTKTRYKQYNRTE